MFLSDGDRSRTPTERGSALLSVLGLMAVTAIIGIVLTAVTVSALGSTSASRATVQSRAAAESGIDVASLTIRQGRCQRTYVQTVPNVTALAQYQKNDGSWGDCPTALATAGQPGFRAQRYRVVSTGTAQAKGVSGNSRGDSSVVEAIFGYRPVASTGPSLYLYSGITVKNNAALSSNEVPLSIQVKNGSILCENNGAITGTVTIESGTISNCGTPTIGTLPVPGWVDIGYEPGTWINADETPYRLITPIATAANCDLNALVASAATALTPAVVDARVCSAGVAGVPGVTGGGAVTLKNDLVIYAEKFDFTDTGGQTIIKSLSPGRFKLWFITPDYVSDGVPTCSGSSPAQENFAMKNGFTIDPSVDAMLYTPCLVTASNNFSWHGQMYAKAIADIKNNSIFNFKPVGLAGFDGDTGRVSLGLISLRDLAR